MKPPGSPLLGAGSTLASAAPASSASSATQQPVPGGGAYSQGPPQPPALPRMPPSAEEMIGMMGGAQQGQGQEAPAGQSVDVAEMAHCA